MSTSQESWRRDLLLIWARTGDNMPEKECSLAHSASSEAVASEVQKESYTLLIIKRLPWNYGAVISPGVPYATIFASAGDYRTPPKTFQ